MGKYVENNLNKNETVVKEAKLHFFSLVTTWIFALLFFWLLFIPVIKAIIFTVKFFFVELAITNKRIIGKSGVIDSSALDAPLNKIQSVATSSGLGGKIFGYGDITINTAAGKFVYSAIANPEEFKRAIMAQIDQAEEDRVQEQARAMAAAMSGAINNNNTNN